MEKMLKRNKKGISLIFALVLLLGVIFQPISAVLAAPIEPIGKASPSRPSGGGGKGTNPSILVRPVTAAGDLIKGGEYEVYKIATIGDDGNETPITEELITTLTAANWVEETDYANPDNHTGGYAFTFNETGRFRIMIKQVKRAPGYLLTNYSATKVEGTTETEEVTQGFIAKLDILENEVYKVNHKQERVTLDTNIVKLDQNGEAITDGKNVITFDFATNTWKRSESYVANGPSQPTEDINPQDGKLDLPDVLSVTLDELGALQLPALEEGTYTLTETATKDGLNLMDKPVQITVKAIDGKEDTAASESDLEIVYNGDAVNTNYDAEGQQLQITNFDQPTIKKEVKKLTDEETAYGKIATGDTNDEFIYKMTVTLPGNATSYENLHVTDAVPAEFDIKMDTSAPVVTVKNGTALTADKYTATATGNNFKLEINPTEIANLNTAQKLEVTLVVTPKPGQEGKKIVNNAKVHWELGGKPNENPVPPEDTPEVYLHKGEFEFTKVDAGANTPLAGATFYLTTIDTEDNVVAKDLSGADLKVTTTDNGLVKFENIPLGKYKLVEETAPDGYKIVKAHHDVEVKVNDTDKTKTDTTVTGTNIVDGEGVLNYKNYKTTSFMPATGTRGLIPYFIGAGSVALLAMFFVLGKKREKQEVK